jgi:hypothetical protein
MACDDTPRYLVGDGPSTAQPRHPLTVEDVCEKTLLLHALLHVAWQLLLVDDWQRVVAIGFLADDKCALAATMGLQVRIVLRKYEFGSFGRGA